MTHHALQRSSHLALTVLFLAAMPLAAQPAMGLSSLEGTEPDGRVAADIGRLVVDSELRAFFDHFLTARHEVSDAELASHVARLLAERLPAAAAAEGAELFDAYILYLDTAARELAAPIDGDPATAFTAVTELRRQVLGERVTEVFFGAEERVERATLELAALHREDAPKTAVLAAKKRLDAALPEADRATRVAAQQPFEVAVHIAEMRGAGAGDGEVFNLRAAAFGSEAAERLAELDRRRAAWQERLESYRAERARLLADSSFDATARVAALEVLLAERFDARERMRVEALERSAQGEAASLWTSSK